MASCRIINFKGIDIVYTDVSHSTTQECLDVIDENHEMIKSYEKKSALSLVNVEKAQIDMSLINVVRENVNRNNPYVLATAVIGLNPFKQMIMDTITALTGRNIVVLDSLEEAKLWLHDQYKKVNVD